MFNLLSYFHCRCTTLASSSSHWLSLRSAASCFSQEPRLLWTVFAKAIGASPHQNRWNRACTELADSPSNSCRTHFCQRTENRFWWGGVGWGGVGWGGVGWGSNNVLSLTSMNATLPTSLRTCNYVDECYVANVSKNFQLCGCMRKMEWKRWLQLSDRNRQEIHVLL